MKTKKILLLAGGILLFTKGYCGLDWKMELAKKFLPSLQLHSQDQGVSPKPVEIMSNGRVDGITSFLNEYDLYCRTFNIVGQLSGDFHINDKGWKVRNIANWPISLYHNWLYDQEPFTVRGTNPNGADGDFYVFFHYDFGGPGRDSLSTWYEDYHKLLGLYNDTIYAHVFSLGDKAVIQYWFFYPFNDWVNNHEGDWEHINVIVSSQDPATAKIEKVDYYFHGHVTECTQLGIDFFVDDQTHPIVFVGGHGKWSPPVRASGSGEGSHGSYPVKGYWKDAAHIKWNYYADEYIDGSGEFLSYKTFDLKMLPEKDDVVYGKDFDLYWMRSNIRWGHVECNSPGDWLNQLPFVPSNLEVGQYAPRGPNFKQAWNDTGETSSDEYKWYPKTPPYSPVTNSGYTIPKVGIIKGKITDKDTGAPMPWATVKVIGRYRSATTNGNGEYKIALPVGKYNLQATKKGFYDNIKNQIDITEGKEVSLDFILEALDSDTTNNVYIASVSNLYKQAFKDTGLLASGVYLAKRVDVRADIPFIYNYLETPSITLSTNGWSFANPNYGGNWGHIISQSTSGFTARTCVYELWNIAGQYLGYYPCKPQDIYFSYTIEGKRETGTGSVSGKVILTETGKPLGGVEISVLQKGKIKGSVTTSSDGLYTFSNLLAGIYDIMAVVNKDTQQVKRISINQGKEAKIDFLFEKYTYKTYSRDIYVSSRKGSNYTFSLSPSDSGYEIYNWSYSIYKQKNGRDDGTYIDYANNRLVIKIRLDGKWYRKAKYGAVYTIYTRKLVIEDPSEIATNSITLDESSMDYQEKTFYLYPSSPNYKIYKWEHKVNGCWNAEDNGTYIDYPNNRLIIKVKLKGYTTSQGMLQVITPAQYRATYYVYGRLSSPKATSIIPIKIKEERPIKKPKVFLSIKEHSILSDEIRVSILVSGVEDEIREAKINLSYNPSMINIKNVLPPIFEDTEEDIEQERNKVMSQGEEVFKTSPDSIFLNSNIDNTKGEASIETALVSFDEIYCDDVPTSFPITQSLSKQVMLEKEDAFSIAELIISLPFKASGITISASDILPLISLYSIELKNSEGNIIEPKLEEDESNLPPPKESQLLQSFPNPAENSCYIPFKLSEDSEVKVEIYNILGQKVRNIEVGQRKAGSYTQKDRAIFWDLKNNNGENVSKGLYFYKLKAGNFSAIKSMVVK